MVIQLALPEDAQLANAIRGPYRHRHPSTDVELSDADEQLLSDLGTLVRYGLVELHQDADGDWRAALTDRPPEG
jgi:hypothetical protein